MMHAGAPDWKNDDDWLRDTRYERPSARCSLLRCGARPAGRSAGDRYGAHGALGQAGPQGDARGISRTTAAGDRWQRGDVALSTRSRELASVCTNSRSRVERVTRERRGCGCPFYGRTSATWTDTSSVCTRCSRVLARLARCCCDFSAHPARRARHRYSRALGCADMVPASSKLAPDTRAPHGEAHSLRRRQNVDEQAIDGRGAALFEEEVARTLRSATSLLHLTNCTARSATIASTCASSSRPKWWSVMRPAASMATNVGVPDGA